MLFNLLDIDCSDKELLKKAFTHPSYTKENNIPSEENYERLEFLGDAVLKLGISNLLYEKYPDYSEGELSKIRSILVSDATLAKIAKEIGLNKFLILGCGEEKTGGRERESNIACSLEAIFAVYFIEGKFDYIIRFLKERILPLSDDIENHFEKYNAKAVLQEYTQGTSGVLPEYNVVKITGPAHSPVFEVQVSYDGKFLAMGKGRTKKDAHQDAAYKACSFLGIINGDENE